MAGSALMLILGCLIAIAVIVFLSNAAPSKGAAAASTTVEAATSDAGGTGASADAGAGAGAGAGAAGGSAGAGGAATGADMGAGAGSLAAQNYAAASSSNKDTLRSGETLAEGDSLTSKNGKYVFTYEYGTATMKSGSFTMWSSSGRPATGGVVKITDDGNLGIFPSQYSVTPSGWASGTAGQGTKPYSLIVRDAGQLIMLDSTPTVIWTAQVTMPPVGVDCVMGDWGEWSACSKNCGGGTQTRNRIAITQPNAGGKACGDLVETKPCNTDPCPDCAFTWAPFGQCVTQSPSTGAGKKQAQLLVSSPSGPGGAVCPDPNSNIQDCVNCVFSPWNPAGALSAQTCNQTTGKKTQSRTITVPASGGGTCNEPTTREEACTVNCGIGSASGWTACANGTRTRTAPVNFTPKNSGTACDVVFNNAYPAPDATTVCTDSTCTQTQQCAACVMSDWGPFGACSTNCGTGTQTRTRTVTTQPKNQPACPPELTNDQACTNNDGCVVDAVCDWSDWSACDSACDGKQTRTRTTVTRARNGGSECAGQEARDCNNDLDHCRVRLYDGYQWAGNFADLGIGYKTGFGSAWYQVPLGNDSVKSIDVPNGRAVTLFRDVNGGGSQWTILGDGAQAHRSMEPDWFKNETSSVKVWQLPKGPPIGQYVAHDGTAFNKGPAAGESAAGYNVANEQACATKCDHYNACAGYAWNKGGWCELLKTQNPPTGASSTNWNSKKRNDVVTGVTKDQLKAAQDGGRAPGVMDGLRGGTSMWDAAYNTGTWP